LLNQNPGKMRKLLLAILVLGTYWLGAQTAWQAPPEADQLVNPLKGDEASIKKGEKIYQSLCASCHGKTGKGDVPAMQSLRPKPTDLTSEAVQKQSDGAIFWKISEGRGLMASYKNMLSEEDRWALVNYIRSLAPEKKNLSQAETEDQSENDQQQNVKAAEDQTHLQKRPSTGGSQPVDAFPFTVLINAKTTHFFNPETFGFVIQHRFGPTKLDEGFWRNFMGLDLSANVRFAFEIPFGDRFYAEIGRTRYGKFYDFGAKYLVFSQTKDEKYPVSLALYGNVAIDTDKAPVFPEDATFLNGAPFEFKWYHRFYYDSQVIVSRKFSDKFSAQITGELIWRNLAPPPTVIDGEVVEEKNYILAFPIAMRYRLGYLSALSLEFMPNTHPGTTPFALAYEIASSGNHVFQITLSNTDRFLPQMLFTHPTYSAINDGLLLGFNLFRYF